MTDSNQIVVMKFGGTSVASLERWQTIAAQAKVKLDRGEVPFLVCSAVSGISNFLEEMIGSFLQVDLDQKFKEFKTIHERFGCRYKRRA